MPDHFLSTGQVAEYLGMSRDSLMHQIRSNEFLEPDVVVGERGIQGWSVERVEQLRQERSGQVIECDTGRVVALINEVRAIAEVVRAYGDRRLSAATALLVAAAEMESDVRGLISSDADLRRVTGHDTGDAGLDPVLVAVPVDPVDVISVPSDVAGARRGHELVVALRRLDWVIRELPTVYASAGGRRVGYALAAQRGEVADYVKSLETTDPDLRRAVLTSAVEAAVSAVTAAGRISGLSDGERGELQKNGAMAERAAAEIASFLTEIGTASALPEDARVRAGHMLTLGYHDLVAAVIATQALVEAYAARGWGAVSMVGDEALLDSMARLEGARAAWSEFLPG